MAENDKRDGWDKFKILSDPIGKVLTALLVAVLGYYVKETLQKEQENHAYIDLLNQREQSDDALRKDMFGKVIDTFVTPRQTDLNSRILDLELLAYNFHESIDLGPLLKEVYAQASVAKNEPARERLLKLAAEIVGRELVTLREVGCVSTKDFKFDDLDDQWSGDTQSGEGDDDRYLLAVEPGNCPGSPHLPCRKLRATVSGEPPRIDRKSPVMNVILQYGECGDSPVWKELDDLTVSPFDFPITHNVRLEGGGRVAISISEIDSRSIAHLNLLYFPDSYTSLRDKPFLDDVIEKLRNQDH
jgi:hypothetical protein